MKEADKARRADMIRAATAELPATKPGRIRSAAVMRGKDGEPFVIFGDSPDRQAQMTPHPPQKNQPKMVVDQDRSSPLIEK